MSSENKRTDDYWMGVRDALRMVDSFNMWAARNPGRAKSLDDFIHDGLIAAAKRCESCLREKLGLSFVKEDGTQKTPPPAEKFEPDVVTTPDVATSTIEPSATFLESSSDADFEIAVDSSDHLSNDEVSIETEEPSLSIDIVERADEHVMEDLIIEGPPREFSSDFVLVEPSSLTDESEESSPIEPETSESLDRPEYEASEHAEELISEPSFAEKRPVFTWSDYEAAVSPQSELESLESESEESRFVDDDYEASSLEDRHPPNDATLEEPQEPPQESRRWSDFSEISAPIEEIKTDFHDDTADEGMEEDIDESEASSTPDETTTITEPPSPPPPPETEEDEEERRRRARRLFFGD